MNEKQSVEMAVSDTHETNSPRGSFRLGMLIYPSFPVLILSWFGLIMLPKYQNIIANLFGSQELPTVTRILFDVGPVGFIIGGIICSILLLLEQLDPVRNRWCWPAGLTLSVAILILVGWELHSSMRSILHQMP